MALTKVKLIADGVITSANLDASHGITTSDIGEGSNLYYTDSRVSSYLSTNGFATQTDIVAAITDSAPVTLDTLNELAAALGDDPNFATTTATSLGLKAPLASPSFTGNVGIGIDSPVVKLEIQDSTHTTMKIRSGNNDNILFAQAIQSNDARIGTDTNTDLSFYSNASERIRIDSSGNVGIGVTPSSWQIISDSNALQFYGSYIYNYRDTNLILGNNAYYDGTWKYYKSSIGATKFNSGNGAFDFAVSSSGTANNAITWVEALKIDSSGNVRIGTGGLTNTHSKLDVIGGPYAFLALQATDTGGRRYELFSYATTESFHIYDRTNDQYRFTIDETGNVGIGVTSPAHKLQVNGDSTVNAGRKFGWVYNPGADNNMYNYIQTSITPGQSYAAEPLEISGARWTGGNTRSVIFTHQTGGEIMTIMTGGNVGIGTDSPSGKLHVKNRSDELDMVVKLEATRDAYLQFSPANTTKWALIADYPATGDFTTYNYPNNFNSIIFKDNKDITTNLSGGNFGIGTTTPSEKLHVVTTALFGPNGSTSRSTDGVGINFTNNNTFSANADLTDANRYLAITNDSTTANAYAPLSFRVHPDGSTSNAMADIKLVSNGSSHHLTTTIRNPATGNFIDTISIAQDGNVGIGTTSPGHRLDVYRDRIALTGLTAGTGGHYIALSGQLPGYTANQYNCLETNLTDLHFAAGGTYTGYISHNGGFTDVSDASLKENIQDIPDALNKVINLRGRYFTWKNELQSDNTQIGFIAQEVEEYVPEVVTSGAGGIKGIAYGKMTALLVNAIKELKADNDNLRERIQTLENQ